MFANRYFAKRFFPARYFPTSIGSGGGGAAVGVGHDRRRREVGSTAWSIALILILGAPLNG